MRVLAEVLSIYILATLCLSLAVNSAQSVEITVPVESVDHDENTVYTGIFGFRQRGVSNCANGQCAVPQSFQLQSIPKAKAADCACEDCQCGIQAQQAPAEQQAAMGRRERPRVFGRLFGRLFRCR